MAVAADSDRASPALCAKFAQLAPLFICAIIISYPAAKVQRFFCSKTAKFCTEQTALHSPSAANTRRGRAPSANARGGAPDIGGPIFKHRLRRAEQNARRPALGSMRACAAGGVLFIARGGITKRLCTGRRFQNRWNTSPLRCRARSRRCARCRAWARRIFFRTRTRRR